MKTLLVLEDDSSNISAFRIIFQPLCNMPEATTGVEALQLVNNYDGPIDLFVSDVALPDLSAIEVALRIIQSRPRLHILFLSGTPMDDWCESDLRNFRQLPPGFNSLLEKPVHLSILEAKVESLVNSHARVSDARR
jgi:two-component system, cell cycle sensor histidine kinase and response regulator CckA